MENFYSHLPVLDDFNMVCNMSNYQALPDDWYIVVADISNSTIAIKSGRYKSVNLIGVSVISSILNISKPYELPYIFGGDGASLCIPKKLVSKSKDALLATKYLAENNLDLDLRVGIISVSQVREAGMQVLVAKHKVSQYCTQAAFAGGGIEYAEYLLKNNNESVDIVSILGTEIPKANYSGLECRWDNVPSAHGETISLIVKATMPLLQEQARFYEKIIIKIAEIYGEDTVCRPVTKPSLSFTLNNKKLSLESKLHSFRDSKFSYLKSFLFIRLQIMLGWIFMKFNLNIGDIKWGEYKNDIITNTDFKKFDGTLRIVISGNSEQRLHLEEYLKYQLNNNKCVYGIHYSDSAYITCLINNRSGNHYHFVDGSGGGYALAALQMKKQLQDCNI
jgi:hypothetical protein